MAQWLGMMVSIRCKEDVFYQGEICLVTTSKIKLIKAFCNGIPSSEEEVDVCANQIMELKLIDKPASSNSITPSKTPAKILTRPPSDTGVRLAKPIAKKPERFPLPNEQGRVATKMTTTATAPSASSNVSLKDLSTKLKTSKPIDIVQRKTPNNIGGGGRYNISHIKEENASRHLKLSAKDEECFGSPLNDDSLADDFDFETNLALFDKKALWKQLNRNHKSSNVLKILNNKKKPKNYRHDENILESQPVTTFRQISMPKHDYSEYVTDDGLIIPSVTVELRKKLFAAADRAGLTWEKRIELLGRASVEISIQLVGGGHRLNPHNGHQVPTIVILCGPHKNGAIGINAARQLASHGIHTVLYIPKQTPQSLNTELSLYALTKNPLVHTVSTLPPVADLIIVALCDGGLSTSLSFSPWYADVTEYASASKAPMLALEPPPEGTVGVEPKFSLVSVLPLAHSERNGKLYLCNLGFPVEIFNEVGIKYKSPFGHKFIIPLHPKDD